MVRKLKPSKEEKKSAEPAVDAPDEFLSISQRGFDWMAENSKLVIAVLAVLLVAGLGYSLAMTYTEHVSTQASDLLAEALRQQQGQVDLTGTTEATDDAPVFASEEEKLKATRSAAEALVKAYPTHNAGNAGRLLLGRACLELADLECSLGAYQDFLTKAGVEDPMRNQALLGLGAAQEQKGEQAAAADTYKKLADGRLGFMKDLGLYHAGRVLAQLGEADQARGYLERIETDFPDSPIKPEATKVLDTLP